jgi:hypothetical protein
VVLLSSIDAYSFERDSTARAVWLAELTRAGAYRKREFRLPPGAWLVRGIEVPSVTAYVRAGMAESQRR